MMKKPKIIHVLADGTKVNSIAGKVVPGDNPVYEVILQNGCKKERRTA